METRKVQLTGGSTYTVSLPKQWAAEHDIEAGRRLRLYPRTDGSLLLRTDHAETGEETTTRVSVDGLDAEALGRTVQALYIVGLDEFALTARSLTTAQRRAVAAAAAGLIGLETVEESERRIVLRSLLSSSEVSVRQSTVQLQFVALSMYREAMTALADADAELAGHVIERDDEADRLFGLVNRHFQRALDSMSEIERLGIDRPTAFDYYATARQLERVADHAERIATVATRLDAPPEAGPIGDIRAAARRSRGIVEDAASVLLGGGSAEQAYDALAARKELTAELEAIDRALYAGDASEAYLLGLVVDSVERATDYGANVAETAVQASVRVDDG